MGYELGLQSNQLKDFSVSIDGTKLTNTQILSIKIKWNMNNFKIIGEVSFDDFSNLVENLPIRGDEEIVMAMTDFDDAVSKQKFKITDVQYTRVQSGKPVVKLLIMDVVTVKAMQMYNEMSWKKADMIEIIDHDETLKPSLTGKKKNFASGLPKHKNFVMPLHVPFNVVTHWLARNNNMMWYQTREDFVIQPLKKIFGESKKGDKFRYQTPNASYRRKIYEYKANFGKVVESNAFLPNGKVASFDVTKKDPKWEKADFKGALDKISSKGAKDAKLPGTGDKHFYRTDYNIKESTEFMWGKNVYKTLELEILVPGKFDTNIGDIVELDLVNYTKNTEPESNLNGEWMIMEITDFITPPDYVMRLVLVRAKFAK